MKTPALARRAVEERICSNWPPWKGAAAAAGPEQRAATPAGHAAAAIMHGDSPGPPAGRDHGIIVIR